jgi:transcriptional regulator with XRE-family HTH domain
MGTAERIKALRERLGKSDLEMAQLLGLNIYCYGDLEFHDDELVSMITLSQALRLASLLGAKLHDLLGDDATARPIIPISQLPERVRAAMIQTKVSLEEFEDRVGWELREFLDKPVQTATERPVIFLQDLAAQLGLDWLSIVPNDNAA